MIIQYPELEQYKAKGFRGVFCGGCVERGEGSSFRAKAHAHNEKTDPLFGWVCVRSYRRLKRANSKPSFLILHELAHILAPNQWHNKTWLKRYRELKRSI